MSGAPRVISPSVNGWNAEYLEAEYGRFKADPASVSPDLSSFFQGFDLALSRTGAASAAGRVDGAALAFQAGVDRLIFAYRSRGHLIAKLDPFGRERPRPHDLKLEAFGLSEADLSRHVASDIVPPATTLRDLITHLEGAYCRSIGLEYMHITDEVERHWFRDRIEGKLRPKPLSNSEQIEALQQITAVERFELFLGKRFQGKKRFSIEGADSLIPMLKALTQRAGERGVHEVVVGMAHRGRLAVLRNYVGKDLGRLFTEFKDAWSEGRDQGGGDVKYHRGYSGDQALPSGGNVHISMLNNPSHLESVNAVVMGRCRAKQDITGDQGHQRVVSLLIHGDAAVIGQGVVAECLNMSKLEGYDVGGAVHIVINNLVGFTTDPDDSRSTVYCTDIGKMVNTPVIHVNGDDVEAVVHVARMALEYRDEFRKDIFVDMVCFRRYGHNESDEPAYTQPQLYALVKNHPGPAEVYRRRLIAAGVLTQEQADAMIEHELAQLDSAYDQAAAKPVNPVPEPGGGLWAGLNGEYTFDTPKTAIDAKVIAEVCAAMGRTPEGFNVHPKLKGLLQARAALPTHNKLSHADAEMIAFGTLVLEGTPVRLSGQDSRRGTFTQRHAVLRDEKTGEKYTPLDHIREVQRAKLSVWDSPLSEYSVMGFDYGYSRANPRALTLWEAQFGDFCNTAQVIIDQYLAASEVKWSRWGGLVLLLPHGYEGQGPEHSSARLERFLQLCADNNMEVVYPSTAAQTFHVLRRQSLRKFRKPLIVLTPKKYLRVETATVQELSTGAFQHIIDDPAHAGGSAKNVTSVVYCSGKVYHELHERREAIARTDVAIVRIEQLYPLHTEVLRRIDSRYPKAAKRTWVQEEPRNQGAYLFIADRFREELSLQLPYIGRPPSASPATGSERASNQQQQAILNAAIGVLPEKKAEPAPDAHAKGGNGSPAKPGKATAASGGKSKH
jgi:2-oxoglutarate dehydrogenase E1 component